MPPDTPVAPTTGFRIWAGRCGSAHQICYTARREQIAWSPLGVAKRNPFAAIAHGHDLAEAIVDAIREPLLVLDPDLRVIAASRRSTDFRSDAAQDGGPAAL